MSRRSRGAPVPWGIPGAAQGTGLHLLTWLDKTEVTVQLQIGLPRNQHINTPRKCRRILDFGAFSNNSLIQ